MPLLLQYDFFINPASNLIPLAFLYVLITYLWLLVTQYILNSTDFKCLQNIKLYHFVRTILSIPFCPMPFCPYTILSIPFCPYHFVRYHFVRSPVWPIDKFTCSCRLALLSSITTFRFPRNFFSYLINQSFKWYLIPTTRPLIVTIIYTAV